MTRRAPAWHARNFRSACGRAADCAAPRLSPGAAAELPNAARGTAMAARATGAGPAAPRLLNSLLRTARIARAGVEEARMPVPYVFAVTLMIALLVCATLALASPSQQVPIGPRAIGMAGAFSSIADDATALFWNPAGLARLGHQEVSVSHANLFGSDIKDNYASFVLPLSPDQAAATDWYHSGYDDGELGFGENRVGLGYALKLKPWLYAGATGRLVTRNTDLDGTSVRSGQGYGLDLGVLVSPMERLRFGLVAQDALNTSVQDSDGISEVVYPRNLRVAGSYSYRNWGTAALDVDDRWHLGVEVTPIEQLAVRFGTEDDLSGNEPGTWTYGLGVKAGVLRVDWARVQHPTLDDTDHFSVAMEFNFNPALIRIEKVESKDLYTSLYKSYANEPFGTIAVRNLQDRPMPAKLSVYVPELMDGPSEQDIILRPHATQDIPVTAVFGERVLAQRGDRPIEVQVAASYQSKRLVRREKGAARAVAYAPGAINWGDGVAQVAAFITPRDPAVDALARQASRMVALEARDPLGNRNLSYAAAMTDALKQLGVAYVPDPNNPYSTISQTPHAVDTIHYPYQTLERRSGDCDDTTVLLASLLGNVGVPTKLVDAPGHIFLLVGTGLHERNRMALGVDSTMYLIDGEEVWVPLETTALRSGFAEAWRAGAEEIASWTARGELAYVDVADAQSRYEPVLPPGDRKLAYADTTQLAALLAGDVSAVAKWRDDYYAAEFGAARNDLEISASAQEEIARVLFLGGDLPGARTQLEQALARAPQSVSVHNNLAVVLAGEDSLEAAEQHWRTALALGASDPGLWLNLGLTRWVQGDTVGAVDLLARGLAGAGGYANACTKLGLPPDDAADRAGGAPMTEAETRALLRAALQRVPQQAIAKASAPSAKPVPAARAPRTRTAATRSAQKMGLQHYLYWIE
jgi:tetratricopeptide (TPR) repeat protein